MIIYIDGGKFNGKLKGRYGYAIGETEKHWSELKHKTFCQNDIKSNEEAVYKALIKCLESLKEEDEIIVLCSNWLVVNQLNRKLEVKIKNRKLNNLCEMARTISSMKVLTAKIEMIPTVYNRMRKILLAEVKHG